MSYSKRSFNFVSSFLRTSIFMSIKKVFPQRMEILPPLPCSIFWEACGVNGLQDLYNPSLSWWIYHTLDWYTGTDKNSTWSSPGEVVCRAIDWLVWHYLWLWKNSSSSGNFWAQGLPLADPSSNSRVRCHCGANYI